MTSNDPDGPWVFEDPWTNTHPDRPLADDDTNAVLTEAVRSLIALRSPGAQNHALAHLHALVSLTAQIRAQLADLVADARDQDYSWNQIAGQLQLSLAAVRRRYGAYTNRRSLLGLD